MGFSEEFKGGSSIPFSRKKGVSVQKEEPLDFISSTLLAHLHHPSGHLGEF